MNRIRELRKAHGLSQVQLAQQLKVTQTAISQWEKERTNPDLMLIHRMSEVFGVSMDYLMGYSDLRGGPQDGPQDEGLRMIERARDRMSERDRERMMRILKAAFESEFADED